MTARCVEDGDEVLAHGDHLKGGFFLVHCCRVGRIGETFDQLDQRGGRGIKRGTSC